MLNNWWDRVGNCVDNPATEIDLCKKLFITRFDSLEFFCSVITNIASITNYGVTEELKLAYTSTS
jgi:hypothetical protein